MIWEECPITVPGTLWGFSCLGLGFARSMTPGTAGAMVALRSQCVGPEYELFHVCRHGRAVLSFRLGGGEGVGRGGGGVVHCLHHSCTRCARNPEAFTTCGRAKPTFLGFLIMVSIYIYNFLKRSVWGAKGTECCMHPA